MSSMPPPAEVERCLREASRLTDLSAATRLSCKIDLSPEGIRRRLQEASDLLDACTQLATVGADGSARTAG